MNLQTDSGNGKTKEISSFKQSGSLKILMTVKDYLRQLEGEEVIVEG